MKKIPVVFLPGKLCDVRVWAPQMTALADIIDPIFVDLTKYSTMDEMLNAVIGSCNDKFILIGFSMGGFAAQDLIIKYPEKVMGLGLVGTTARGYTEEERAYQILLMNNAKKQGFKGISDVSLRKFIHPSNYNNIELTTLVKDMARDCGAEVFIRQQEATLDRKSTLEALKNVTCPTICIGGADDQILPNDQVKEIADTIPHAEFFSVPECGHMVTLEKPYMVTNILRDWITRHFIIVNK
jgi:pimeloyl-ACP methyl ester carboxylesterase